MMAHLDFPAFRNPPLNQHYEGKYDENMIRWREVNARDKAANVMSLLGPRAKEVGTVLEVGCGTGAVLLEIARLGIGASHVGVDMADPGEHAHPGVIEAGIELREVPDGKLPFDDGSFDLVVASHVLEHVENERAFLAELARVTRRWIYIEVPCEINVRTTIRDLQTTLDIGHINSYTPETFHLTLATSGLEPDGLQIFDFSMDNHAFHISRSRAAVKAAIRRSLLWLSPRLASRVFVYHVGALCPVPNH